VTDEERLIRCVGAVVHDDHGRLLLIRRATDPGRGRWSLPGGRVEQGESDAQALRRELLEEVGLPVLVGDLVGSVRRPAPDGAVYVIFDYRCAVAPSTPDHGSDRWNSAGAPDRTDGSDIGPPLRPGDDAADARWVSSAEYAGLPVVDGLTETLAEWSVLPR
jgi:8-oxo-dGTP diphosphatase